ncbi:MAG: hypothetical protein AAFV95_29345, partial [Bacteroidota bacterium]
PNLSLLYFQVNQLDTALVYSIQSTQLQDSLRSFQQTSSNRHLYVEKSLSSLEVGIISATSLKQCDLSFELSEKSKGRGLVDLLAEKSITPTIEKDSLDDYRSLKARLQALNQNLRKVSTAQERGNIRSLRDSLFGEFRILQERIKARDPAYANLVYPETVNRQEVQSILQKQEVVISVFTGYLRSYAYIITKDQQEVIDLGPTDSLENMITHFRQGYIDGQKSIFKGGKINIRQK